MLLTLFIGKQKRSQEPKSKGAVMSLAILYTLYFIGFRMYAVDLAVEWSATAPIGSKKAAIGSSFIDWQKEYPICEYCKWPICPVGSHEFCEQQMQDEANWLEFVEDEEAKMAQWALEYEEQQRSRDEDIDLDEEYPEDEDDDELVSTSEVYSRALRCFGGNHEMAREATELYPGDFI